jgi:uncharacterized membrane protein YkvA (DUF1232 family)
MKEKAERRGFISNWRRRAKSLVDEARALYLASKDARTPWYANVLITATIAYAVSPIDLIPDFIPVLGFLDDLVIVPAGIYLSLKMIPDEVMQECRLKARANPIRGRSGWVAAGVFVSFWMAAVAMAVIFIRRLFV